MTGIRLAKPDDAERLLEIYAPFVKNTTTSFETEVPSVEEFAQRITDISHKYPYFVYEDDGAVVGYAYASQHYRRAAYEWNAEISLYITDEYQGRGIGRTFYGLIEDILLMQGVKNMMAIITVPNDASIELCEFCGFSTVGLFPKAGYKKGRWCDVVNMEKEIAPRESEPAHVVSFCDLRIENVKEAIKKWEKYIRV